MMNGERRTENGEPTIILGSRFSVLHSSFSPHLRVTLLFFLGAALFAVAYCQAPLYYSNQNQYLVHGLANAGQGLLRDDWLAKTLDPTPVFSALVTVTALTLPSWAFYVWYGLLFGIYAAAMLGLFVWLVGPAVAARRWPVFIALFLLVHAALPRWLSYQWLGRDYPWYFQAGVAGQYLLGCMFQPSTFGVLLVAAISLFFRGRLVLAGACVALAASLHATYLLPGALLTLGFLTALVVAGRPRAALALGASTLALVLPVTVYVLVAFAPTSPAKFAEAQDVLVNLRIPHHTRPDIWLDRYAVLQGLWIVLSLMLVRRTQLFAVLAVPFVMALLLTLVQAMTGNASLALVFPWRTSTVLVPVATAVIFARLTAWPALPVEGFVVRMSSLALIAGLVIGGAWITLGRLALRTADEENPVMDFVFRTKAPGDIYFLPVRVPNLAASVRGAQSTDFKPLPQRRQDNQVIPVDMQRFRLATGAPIYVDFKAIPYKDIEVLEWRKRLDEAEKVQEELRQGRFAEAFDQLRRLGVTHLVRPKGSDLPGAGFHKIYEDPAFQVYQLRAASPE